MEKRLNWDNEEIQEMLNIIKEKNILSLNNGKKYRSLKTYEIVQKDMKTMGFQRTPEQIRTKLKQLKQKYFDIKKQNQTSGVERKEIEYFETLDELFGSKTATAAPAPAPAPVTATVICLKSGIESPISENEDDSLSQAQAQENDQSSAEGSSSRTMTKEKKLRLNWDSEEVDYMLNIVKERNILSLNDGKKYHPLEIYEIVENDMGKLGFQRTAEQIRTKLKQLKQNYVEIKRNGKILGNGTMDFEHYEILDEMFGSRPTDTAVCSESGLENQIVENEDIKLYFSDNEEMPQEQVQRNIQRTTATSSNSIITKEKRLNWDNKEVDELLNIVRKKNIMCLQHGRKYRSLKIYKIVREDMRKKGYHRTPEQIRAKLKQLKQKYIETKRFNESSGAERKECENYEILDELFGSNKQRVPPTSNKSVTNEKKLILDHQKWLEKKFAKQRLFERKMFEEFKKTMKAHFDILMQQQNSFNLNVSSTSSTLSSPFSSTSEDICGYVSDSIAADDDDV